MSSPIPSDAPAIPAAESQFDAHVVAALFPREGAAFALADGTVRFEGADPVRAHEDGAVLCAALHPGGAGVLTGGDDGRLVWSRPGEGAVALADSGGRWIDAVAASAASGLIAFASARDVHVRDVADPAFARLFRHERSAADLAFEPKGRRLATASYGGVELWYARIADQKPTTLKWAGSHTGVTWSPDGRYVLSSMQENTLHGWRLSDGKDMRMGGYPAKVRSFAFLAKGALMATSGAQGAVVWPFAGPNGPMGKEAVEIGRDDREPAEVMVTRVAAHLPGMRLCAGRSDGAVWTADLDGRGVTRLRPGGDASISALAVSPDGRRLAWGDEAGGAGVICL